ncbi:AfsA-related hotdog domain-containing protein [Methylophaga sp.]|uniref:AfsA-related hotdog domain-containing protein n=1 Tax=Methylophaga sp. TaxID=2024840 RepID=UPI003A94ACFC
MTTQKLIVSDTFKGFSEGEENVLTYSCLVKLFASKKIGGEKVQLIVGQGVKASDLELLINKYNLSDQISVATSRSILPAAGVEYSHKQKIQNITVTLAQKKNDNNFKLGLIFDGSNEFFLDHMTGKHVQGMAVVEAMRQAFLTVTEQFFLNTSLNKYYFVIHKMDTEFKKFVFPLDAHIEYEIIRNRQKSDRYSASVKTTVIQNGDECAVGYIDFTAFEQSFIGKKEVQLATQAVEYVLSDAVIVTGKGEVSHAA